MEKGKKGRIKGRQSFPLNSRQEKEARAHVGYFWFDRWPARVWIGGVCSDW
jgi:hypothetical protein